MNSFPYLPLTKFGDFIKKLESVGVKKVEIPFSESRNTSVFLLKRTCDGRDYQVVLSPFLENDTYLSVDTIDNILNRLKIDGAEIGFVYSRF